MTWACLMAGRGQAPPGVPGVCTSCALCAGTWPGRQGTPAGGSSRLRARVQRACLALCPAHKRASSACKLGPPLRLTAPRAAPALPAACSAGARPGPHHHRGQLPPGLWLPAGQRHPHRVVVRPLAGLARSVWCNTPLHTHTHALPPLSTALLREHGCSLAEELLQPSATRSCPAFSQ